MIRMIMTMRMMILYNDNDCVSMCVSVCLSAQTPRKVFSNTTKQLKTHSALQYIVYELFSVAQDCIDRSIIPSGKGARGISSGHMENMEMFSCSPTYIC